MEVVEFSNGVIGNQWVDDDALPAVSSQSNVADLERLLKDQSWLAKPSFTLLPGHRRISLWKVAWRMCRITRRIEEELENCRPARTNDVAAALTICESVSRQLRLWQEELVANESLYSRVFLRFAALFKRDYSIDKFIKAIEKRASQFRNALDRSAKSASLGLPIETGETEENGYSDFHLSNLPR